MFKYETDSRKIKKGQTFVAIKGLTVDGHNYIKSAIENGASEIICEHEIESDIPYTIVKDTSIWLKETLLKEYGDKINSMTLIGVTGTNGKTTSCYITYQMLLNLGLDAAYMGTLGFFHKDDYTELDNTTPEIVRIYSLFMDAYEKGCTHIVMEVSSQALSYDRLYGLKFNIIGFTNLTQDHLDYHKTMENYLNAKLLIFNHVKENFILLANSDDDSSNSFIKKSKVYYTYGFDGNYKILNIETFPDKTNIKFSYKDKEYNVTTNLTSKFNVYNYLTMLSIVNNLGFSIEDIIDNTKKLKNPKGRCETYNVNNGYAVVDYAHTPDAEEKIINAYTELKKNKVITIIGCGGDRDPKKRPIMGKIATDLSDYVIFTSDNPRTEDPVSILNEIVKGVNKNNFEIIVDRKEAIKKGIDNLDKEDILLILGKGHEDYQIIGKTKHHLDDAEEVINWKK